MLISDYSQARKSYFGTLQLPEIKIAEFANSVDLDEVAHDEPPHLDLYCLQILQICPSNSSYDIAWTLHFFEILQTIIMLSGFWQLKS